MFKNAWQSLFSVRSESQCLVEAADDVPRPGPEVKLGPLAVSAQTQSKTLTQFDDDEIKSESRQVKIKHSPSWCNWRSSVSFMGEEPTNELWEDDEPKHPIEHKLIKSCFISTCSRPFLAEGHNNEMPVHLIKICRIANNKWPTRRGSIRSDDDDV